MAKQEEANSEPTPRDSSVTCSRRTFFRALFQEAVVIHGSLKGGEGYRLAELSNLPDHQLAEMKPTMNPDCEILVDQNYVCSRSKRTKATLKLFPIESENLLVFNMFNGQHDLEEIGNHLAQETGWDGNRAFAHAKDLFLVLVQHGVCYPKDPPPKLGT